MDKLNIDSNRRIVLDFLKVNFTNIKNMQLENFKMAPGGIIVTDKNNDTILFWYDIEQNKVKWEYPNIG